METRKFQDALETAVRDPNCLLQGGENTLGGAVKPLEDPQPLLGGQNLQCSPAGEGGEGMECLGSCLCNINRSTEGRHPNPVCSLFPCTNSFQGRKSVNPSWLCWYFFRKRNCWPSRREASFPLDFALVFLRFDFLILPCLISSLVLLLSFPWWGCRYESRICFISSQSLAFSFLT